MKPDIKTLFKAYEGPAVATSSTTNILNITSTNQINELTESASVTYRPRNFVPVPPFLVEVFHNSISKSNGSASTLLVDCVRKITSFDTEHASDAVYKDKAKSKCKDIMMWLYLVHKTMKISIQSLSWDAIM